MTQTDLQIGLVYTLLCWTCAFETGYIPMLGENLSPPANVGPALASTCWHLQAVDIWAFGTGTTNYNDLQCFGLQRWDRWASSLMASWLDSYLRSRLSHSMHFLHFFWWLANPCGLNCFLHPLQKNGGRDTPLNNMIHWQELWWLKFVREWWWVSKGPANCDQEWR